MITTRVSGLPDLKAALQGIAPKLRVRALRTALAAGARLVRDDAKRRAPVLSPLLKTPRRKPGTVRDAISVRTSKIARRQGDVGVFVNVRPAAGARFRQGRLVRASQRGANSPNDPFYWRFLEFGTAKMRARPFLQPAAARLAQALEVFKAKIGPAIEKLNRPKAPAP